MCCPGPLGSGCRGFFFSPSNESHDALWMVMVGITGSGAPSFCGIVFYSADYVLSVLSISWLSSATTEHTKRGTTNAILLGAYVRRCLPRLSHPPARISPRVRGGARLRTVGSGQWVDPKLRYPIQQFVSLQDTSRGAMQAQNHSTIPRRRSLRG